jgi:BirA family transcriptional regulator, biotin operon repressor / biotin---[acetyl-CoA-carboxylase] ligase
MRNVEKVKNASLQRLQRLVILLSNGEFHSGENLAKHLSVSRTAIWKLVNKLQSWQINIKAIRGKGYIIVGGLTLLDANYLNQQISLHAKLFTEIEVLPTVDSTSSYLARNWHGRIGGGRICVAEHQTEGRGRKGRKWISPFGSNLYFSLGVNLPMGLSALGGLSLAVGIGLSKLLNRYTDRPVKLKWPNDLLVDNRKLAGILVEASGDSNDNSFLNVGVGINWDMLDLSGEVDQPWSNLKQIIGDEIDRNRMLAIILLGIDKLLEEYIVNGFDSFRAEWECQSAFINKPIVLITRNGRISGVETGIDKSGAIRIKTAEGDKSFFSGEVSLRAR